MSNKLDRKLKDFIKFSWLMLIGGFIATVVGFIQLFFTEPKIGINLKTQQPVVVNGSILFLLGFAFFVVGIYRTINRAKSFKNHWEIEKEMKEIDERNQKKEMYR